MNIPGSAQDQSTLWQNDLWQKLISLFLKKKKKNLAYSEALKMEVNGVNRLMLKYTMFQYYSHKIEKILMWTWF